MEKPTITYYTAMSRGQLAYFAGVNRKTLSRWLKKDAKQLKALGLEPRCIIPPAAVRFICEKYCISLNQKE